MSASMPRQASPPYRTAHQLYFGFKPGRASREQREAAQRPVPVRVAPTMMRRTHGQDHFMPVTGMWLPNADAVDRRLWHGHSRQSHPLRRKANKASWAKILRANRRAYLASKVAA